MWVLGANPCCRKSNITLQPTLSTCGSTATKSTNVEDLQDGGGVRRGDHLPPHKYIKNTSTCGTTPTEYLLNTGRRPQTSQKARKSPCAWVEQKKKEKNRDKRIGMEPAPVGGSCEGGKVSMH